MISSHRMWLAAVALVALSGMMSAERRSAGQPRAAVPTQASAAQKAPPMTILRCGTLLDERTEQPRHNLDVVIEGENIKQVEAATRSAPQGATVIDLRTRLACPA